MKYTAKYVWIENRFESHATFEIHKGVFQHSEVNYLQTSIDSDALDLGDVAVIPGVINAHSHAFQRIIRGRSEHISTAHLEDNFWGWRDAMYHAANHLSAEDIKNVSQFTFLEMAKSGVTSVGEFHYLHHAEDGKNYEDKNRIANAIIEAAKKVGIRISLLNVAYRFGDIAEPAKKSQRRFISHDLPTYLDGTLALRRQWENDPSVNIGFAPHSVRAVDEHWIRGIAREAKAFDMPLHIHASEQRSEVENSLRKRGQTPIEWIDAQGALSSRTTIIHANHATESELESIAKRGSIICACPTTERNLGDGFLPMHNITKLDIPITLGSDSHTQIDIFSDLRLLEYHERLRNEKRNVLAGLRNKTSTAQVLLPLLSKFGAKSIGIGAAEIAPKEVADFTCLDLKHPSLIGADRSTIGGFIALSMPADAVKDVYVGGECIIKDSKHVNEDEIISAYLEVSHRLWKKT